MYLTTWKKLFLISIGMIILLGHATVFAVTINNKINKTTIPTYAEDKLNIMVTKANREFVIKLKSNPTTGYSWFLREYDPSLITPVKHTFETPVPKRIGASGYEVWTFKVKPNAFVVPQQTAVRLIYARPWQGADNSTQLFFRVTILPQ